MIRDPIDKTNCHGNICVKNRNSRLHSGSIAVCHLRARPLSRRRYHKRDNGHKITTVEVRAFVVHLLCEPNSVSKGLRTSVLNENYRSTYYVVTNTAQLFAGDLR